MKALHWLSGCAVVALAVFLTPFAFAQLDVAAESPAPASQSAPRVIPKSLPAGRNCICIGQGDLSRIERIEQALRSPLLAHGLQFEHVSLEQIVASLRDQYDIEVQIDTPALNNIGLSPGDPISVDLRNISLGAALRLMLQSTQLTYVIQDEVLWITTPEEADTKILICVYNVRDLIAGEKEAESLNDLKSVIISCVARNTWAGDKGGGGEIRSLNPGLLVVAQTRQVHDQVGELLTTIRQLRNSEAAQETPRDHKPPGRGETNHTGDSPFDF